MSKIWLDVTTILGWQRPCVGVVRVEAECADYCLNAINDNIYFCRFSADGYQEVKREDVVAALERIRGKEKSANVETIQPAPEMVEPKSAAVLSKRQKIKILFLHTIDLLPAKQRTIIFNFALKRKFAFDALLRSYKELSHAISELIRPSHSESMVYTPNHISILNTFKERIELFGSNDIYISLGLDWDQKDLVYLYDIKRKAGFKVLLFCYDLIPVKFPQLCVGDVSAAFARYFANVAWCADEILCISECSKNDLESLLTELGTPIPSMAVVKLGCQALKIISDNIASDVKYILDQKYILYVSTIERRKNHETLYRAYIHLIDNGIKDLPLLVFVGMPGWGVKDFMSDIQLDPRIKSYIFILNEVSDSDLTRLYKNSLFTVYPSLYEGWGLPVQESLAVGKFCLASNAASIPEAGEQFVEYIDPWNVQEWANRLYWYIENEHEIANKEANIKASFLPQEWSHTASYIISTAKLLREKDEKENLSSHYAKIDCSHLN